MNRIKLITLLTLTISLGTNAQTFEWATNFAYGTSSDQGQSTAVDALGNVYVTGNFQGTVDFDPGPGNATHTSNGQRDIFVTKLDASGNFLWVTTFGDWDDDYGYSITVDASGNVYTTGYFNGTMDVEPGAGVTNLTSISAYDFFIQKLDASGNFVWAHSFGNSGIDKGLSIAVDALGNVYTVGTFEGTVDFNPDAGSVANSTSNGNQDVFLQKLDASGNLVFTKTFGGNSDDVGNSLVLDASGNIYTTGYFQGSVDFDPGAGTTNLSSNGGRDIFIQKLDALGNFVFAKSFGYTGIDDGISIAVDASENIFTTGSFMGTVDFDPGPGVESISTNGQYDIFVQKLDALGNFQWANSFGGSIYDSGKYITTDASGNVYTTGYYQGTVDFDPGAGTSDLISNGGWDIFIQKLDPSGNLLWANSIGGTGQDVGNSIALDISENMHITGTFQGTVDFDPGPGTTNLVSYGNDDPFILKMGNCTPNTGTDTQTACGPYLWIDGNTYFTSNTTATHTVTNVNGCDSVVTLNLTVNSITYGTDTQAACGSYTWIDGNTYTASNMSATHTLTNATGCDSIVTLNLTISQPNTGTDIQSAFCSYTWIDGNTYTSSNNTTTHTLTNVNGCDSIVTLDLTITNTITSTDTKTACDTYTWIDGNTYSSSNTTATHTLSSVGGCDSIVTLNLTINNVSDLSTSVSGIEITATNNNATYQWLDCDNNNSIINGENGQSFTATANGNYAVELTENGCVDTTDCAAITTVGIVENTFDTELLVYPNPTNGKFSIDLGKVYTKTQITIMDLTGKLIESKIESQTQVLNLTVEQEPKGIYIITIQAENKNAVIRLVKE